MTNRAWKSFVLIALIFNLCLNGAAKTPDSKKLARPAKAAEFALKDQFGNELSIKFPRQKVIILAIADKDGSEQLEEWIRPLAEKYSAKYADKLDIQGIAELSSVPGIAKGVVRNFIKKKSERPVMLDWSGAVSKSYSYEKDKANVFLIDRAGNILVRAVGAADAVKLEELYLEIDKLLK